MINKNVSPIPKFASHFQTLTSTMHHRLSGDQNQKIVLSKSLSLSKPFIVPIEEADAECISIEDFLAMLDTRMSSEYAYREEIIQLKHNICDEFNKLCNGVTDEKFITFLRDQRQRVIDTLFDETRIERQMIADRFFNNIMNGFDEEALNLNQFSEIVHTALWKPLLTPLPINLMDEMKKLMNDLGNNKLETKIEEIASKLVQHIKEHMKVKDIRDNNFHPSELRAELEKLIQERQICIIELKDVHKNENIVKEFMGKCVEKVKIGLKLNELLEKEIGIYWEEIELEDNIKAIDWEKAFNKLQRELKFLIMRLEKGSLEEYKKMGECLSKLKRILTLELQIGGHNIGTDGAKVVSAALSELKNISTLILYIDVNELKDEGAKAVSAALRELKNISTLALWLGYNSIKDEGVRAVSAAVKELKNILILTLDFEGNLITEEGATAASAALKELKNISNLALYFTWNNIGVEGAKQISIALHELKKMSTLDLEIAGANIEEEGAKTLSAALRELKNISDLIFHLPGNNIGANGAKAVLAALSELKNISTLNLSLEGNNIGDDGAKAVIAAMHELNDISNLVLWLRYNNIEEECRNALRQQKLNCSCYEIDVEY